MFLRRICPSLSKWYMTTVTHSRNTQDTGILIISPVPRFLIFHCRPHAIPNWKICFTAPETIWGAELGGFARKMFGILYFLLNHCIKNGKGGEPPPPSLGSPWSGLGVRQQPGLNGWKYRTVRLQQRQRCHRQRSHGIPTCSLLHCS